jgi:hypothetical protein
MKMEKSKTTGNYPHLPISLGSELLIEIPEKNIRVRNSLVGMEKGQFILAKIASNDLIGTFRSESIRAGDLQISYLHENTVYGFKAGILNIVSSPARLFFLAYPKKIEELSARGGSRFECVLPATSMLGNELVSIVIVDISKEGCQCILRTPVAKDSLRYSLVQVNKKIEISVQFPGSERMSMIGGRIRSFAQAVDKVRLGIRFEELALKESAEFENFISLVSECKTSG